MHSKMLVSYLFFFAFIINTVVPSDDCKNQLTLQKLLTNQKLLIDSVSEIRGATSYWDTANQKIREKIERLETRMKIAEGEDEKLEKTSGDKHEKGRQARKEDRKTYDGNPVLENIWQRYVIIQAHHR